MSTSSASLPSLAVMVGVVVRAAFASMATPVVVVLLLVGTMLVLMALVVGIGATAGAEGPLILLAAYMLVSLGVWGTAAACLYTLVGQNQPELAKTVPQHVRALRWGMWLVVGVVTLADLTFGYLATTYGHVTRTANPNSVAAKAFAAEQLTWGYTLLTLELTVASLWLSTFVRHLQVSGWWFVVAFVVMPLDALIHALLEVLGWSPQTVLLFTSVAVLTLLWRVHPIREGGERWLKLQRLVRASDWRARSRGALRLSWLSAYVYRLRLRRALMRSDGFGALRERVWLGLGPQVDPSLSVLLALVCSGLWLVLVLDGYSAASTVRESSKLMTTYTLALMVLGSLGGVGWMKRLTEPQAEQALLRLAPGTPDRASLNRAILLRGLGLKLVWVVATSAALLLFPVFTSEHVWLVVGMSPWQVLAPIGLSVVFALEAGQRWAGEGILRPITGWVRGALLFGAWLGTYLVLIAYAELATVIGGLVAGCLVALLLWVWRRTSCNAHPFPVGRLP